MAELRRHNKVRITNLRTGEKTEGTVEAEVWGVEPEDFAPTAPQNGGWGQSAPLAQLIELGGKRYVRFSYYVRPDGGDHSSWHSGGRYPPLIEIDDFRALLRKLQGLKW